MTVIDQMNRTLVFDKAPQRIVSLVPSQTELLAELRLRENILGITKFCIHPEDLKQTTTIVGGTKQVHFDKISSLKPDIILCNKEENTKEMVAELEKIAPVHISDIKTVEDNLELIEQYGLLFNRKKESEQLVSKIVKRYKAFQTEMQSYEWKSVGYFIWRKPYMVASSDTFIDELVNICRFKNVFINEAGRYPEIDIEKLPAMDVLLLSSEPYPFSEKHIKELKQYTRAKIMLVDGEYFSWYGSRLLKAFDYFVRLRKDLNI
ncbi:cobalamin-binding protein [Dokdonia sinensis]|uniref:Cobalamin-binding protein n=1 Tax=Dokdonia sinensis TaxID=2479847 RepID=A0A3M0G234_9FLAO|nr:helical backbone metal receptor [Dokdonia sinensis]RMB56242.1 cobalamin-binding protein [Dokdonia sinensis]